MVIVSVTTTYIIAFSIKMRRITVWRVLFWNLGSDVVFAVASTLLINVGNNAVFLSERFLDCSHFCHRLVHCDPAPSERVVSRPWHEPRGQHRFSFSLWFVGWLGLQLNLLGMDPVSRYRVVSVDGSKHRGPACHRKRGLALKKK